MIFEHPLVLLRECVSFMEKAKKATDQDKAPLIIYILTGESIRKVAVDTGVK